MFLNVAMFFCYNCNGLKERILITAEAQNKLSRSLFYF